MCLLVNGISWFIFQHYFYVLVVLKIMTHYIIDDILDLMEYGKTC